MAARLIKQGVGKTLHLGFGGDVSLGGLIDQSLPNSIPDAQAAKEAKAAKQRHPLLQRGMRTAEVWGDCVGDLQAGVTAISLVSPFTMHGQRSRSAGGGAKRLTQRAHPLQVEALVDANIDFVTLANGHSMDYQEEGLLDTWAALDAASIAHAGSGEDRAAALRPAVLTATGRKIAYFALSAEGCGLRDAAGTEMWAAAYRRAGILHFDLWDTRMHDEALRELAGAIERLKQSQRITFVVVSVCWGQWDAGTAGGPAGSHAGVAVGEVPPQMRSFARALVDVAGADIVHGHGVGHMLGVEVYKGCPILYSCGVLLTDRLTSEAPPPSQQRREKQQQLSQSQPLRPRRLRSEQRPDLSYVARVTVTGANTIGWLELRPIHCRLLQVNRAKGSHLAWALEAMQGLCADLGTRQMTVGRYGLRIAIDMRPPDEPVPRRRVNPEARLSGRQQLGNDGGGSNAMAAGAAPAAWWTRLGARGEGDDDEEEDRGLVRSRRRRSWSGVRGGDGGAGLPGGLGGGGSRQGSAVAMGRGIWTTLSSAVSGVLGSVVGAAAGGGNGIIAGIGGDGIGGGGGGLGGGISGIGGVFGRSPPSPDAIDLNQASSSPGVPPSVRTPSPGHSPHDGTPKERSPLSRSPRLVSPVRSPFACLSSPASPFGIGRAPKWEAVPAESSGGGASSHLGSGRGSYGGGDDDRMIGIDVGDDDDTGYGDEVFGDDDGATSGAEGRWGVRGQQRGMRASPGVRPGGKFVDSPDANGGGRRGSPASQRALWGASARGPDCPPPSPSARAAAQAENGLARGLMDGDRSDFEDADDEEEIPLDDLLGSLNRD